jgi:hypothetical protein
MTENGELLHKKSLLVFSLKAVTGTSAKIKIGL